MTIAPMTISAIGSGFTASSDVAVLGAALAMSRACLRQANSCAGEIPIRRATAEIFTPGSRLAEMASALNSSDQRRRDDTGAPSKRSATASINWILLGLDIGADIVATNSFEHIEIGSAKSADGTDGVGYALTSYSLVVSFDRPFNLAHACIAVRQVVVSVSKLPSRICPQNLLPDLNGAREVTFRPCR